MPLVAVAPEQAVDVRRVAGSAPSIHSRVADVVITVPAGYVVRAAPDDAGPAPTALPAVTVTV